MIQVEPGDKQFRTDAFNADQAQQANASKERGAAALGQGIAGGAQQYVQGKRWQAEQESQALRWQAEFQASQQAQAFKMNVENEKMQMDRVMSQVQLTEAELRKQEIGNRLQVQQAMIANGSMKEQLRAQKLDNDIRDLDYKQKVKEAENEERGNYPLSREWLGLVGQAIGDTYYEVGKNGRVTPRQATEAEKTARQNKDLLAQRKERGEMFTDVFSKIMATSLTSGVDAAEAERMATSIVDKVFGPAPGQGSQQSGQSEQPQRSQISPEKPAARNVGQSANQERYQIVQALAQPKYQVQTSEGAFKGISFDTLFPGGEPDNEFISQVTSTASVLMQQGGKDTDTNRSQARWIVASLVSDYNRLTSDMKAKGQRLSKEQISQLRVVFNAKLHGISPDRLAEALGGK